MPDLTTNIDRTSPRRQPDDEIDLKELLMVFWRGKWLISVVTSLAAAISVAYALSLPNIYTASALLAPSDGPNGGLSSLMTQYSGLASLAGVSLPSGEEGSRAQLGMQLMKSRAFVGDFIERRNILPELMAVAAWDPSSGEVIFNPKLYDASSQKWVRDVESTKSPVPSAQSAHRKFSSILKVSQDKTTGYVSIAVEHESPIVAASLVNWLVEDLNEVVKAQDVAEAERSIEYLKQQVANTSLADLQAMFFGLIQSQTETMMLAEVRPEYVFKIIDPAVVPEQKSKPNRPVICILGTFFGGTIGLIVVLLRYYLLSDSAA